MESPLALEERIRAAIDVAPVKSEPLSGGCVGKAFRVHLSDGTSIAAKVDDLAQQNLSLEAYMLRFLAERSRLPVPAVLYADDQLLLIEFLPGRSSYSSGAQRHAAELLADLHGISAPEFGMQRDTLIGGLHQPNSRAGSWLEFFREQRLMYMGREANRAARLPDEMLHRLGRFCGDLSNWIVEPDAPCLIHGDAWAGNILADGERISGFLDPAIYFADPEIELAFTTLFGTFGDPFFRRYAEIRPLRPGFWEERKDIYNLYPLLVHVRLFGGSYVSAADQTLRRFGH
jgi:fructosamine-3-kinase